MTSPVISIFALSLLLGVVVHAQNCPPGTALHDGACVRLTPTSCGVGTELNRELECVVSGVQGIPPTLTTRNGGLEFQVNGARLRLDAEVMPSPVDSSGRVLCSGRHVHTVDGVCVPNLGGLEVGDRAISIESLVERADLAHLVSRSDMSSAVETLAQLVAGMQTTLDTQLTAAAEDIETGFNAITAGLGQANAGIAALEAADTEQEDAIAGQQQAFTTLQGSFAGISDILDEHADAIEVAAGGVGPLMDAFEHTPFMDHSLPVYRWAVWSTYNQANGQWFAGNNANMFGGVHASTWGDGNGHAGQLSGDKNVLRGLFNKRGYMGWQGTVWAEEWYYYSSTNSRHIGALFRIKNTQSRSIRWRVVFHYTGWSGWGEQAGVNFNGRNMWNTGNNCGTHCTSTVNFDVPADRTSTMIFVVASNSPSGTRSTYLAFRENTLRLPDGLEYADDMDYAEGGWEQ